MKHKDVLIQLLLQPPVTIDSAIEDNFMASVLIGVELVKGYYDISVIGSWSAILQVAETPPTPS